MIEPPKPGYEDIALALRDLVGAVEPILPRIDEFEVGFGAGNPFHYRQTNPDVFGTGPELYFNIDSKGPLVTGIWYDVGDLTAKGLDLFRRTLLAINAVAPSVVADYRLDISRAVGDPVFLASYLGEFAEPEAEQPPERGGLGRRIARIFTLR